MNSIIKKLQDMSRNRSRKYCKVTFTFTSHKYQILRHLSCSEARKTCIRPTMGNKQAARSNIGACSKKILDNINLAAVANELVDRKDSRKKKFKHFSQNYS